MTWKPKIAVISENNVGRSMTASYYLKKRGFHVRTFGVSNTIEVFGPSPSDLNVYNYGTTFEYIYQDLKRKNEIFYTNNKMLELLERNQTMKPAPERFQDCRDKFDIVFVSDRMVYSKVERYILSFSSMCVTVDKLYIMNINIESSLHGAFLGSMRLIFLIDLLEKSKDFEKNLLSIIDAYEDEHQVAVICEQFHY